MSLIIRIGRRIYRNDSDRRWYIRQARKFKNTMSVQQAMWNNIQYALKLATIRMDKRIKKDKKKTGTSKFKYIKKKYIEEESLNFNIEWIRLYIYGTYEEEMDEYYDTLKFFDKIGNNRVFKQRIKSVDINPELAQEYHKKVRGKKAKKLMKKGFEKVKDVSIAKALNDIGIIVIVDKPKKPEDKENGEKQD